jgi:zinc/manganese transport system permease protein
MAPTNMSTITGMSTDMFQYEFMTNAFAAAGIAAVVAGIVGSFLVMRGQTFAGHALSHIGFAGATGAGLIGLAPLWGLLGFALAAGITMGALSERISNRDVAIGIVLADSGCCSCTTTRRSRCRRLRSYSATCSRSTAP